MSAERLSVVMTLPTSRVELLRRTLFALCRWQSFSPDQAA
jgi:hypothetical protein